jgi:hypothetical protein
MKRWDGEAVQLLKKPSEITGRRRCDSYIDITQGSTTVTSRALLRQQDKRGFAIKGAMKAQEVRHGQADIYYLVPPQEPDSPCFGHDLGCTITEREEDVIGERITGYRRAVTGR